MDDVLDKILEARRFRLKESKSRVSFSEMDRMAAGNRALSKFHAALTAEPARIALIAEMKKKSPSAGPLRPDYDVSAIAVSYKNGGADALSVLTEPDFFGGEIGDLSRAKEAASLPALRKDFLFDPYQIAESKAHGADAVLLIAEMLEQSQLLELTACARAYGLEVLLEVFSADKLDSALRAGAVCIGINTRNLRTLEMIPDNIQKISRLIPNDRVVVAESGIKDGSDMRKLKSLPVSAALVGESLLRQTDLESAVRRLKEAA